MTHFEKQFGACDTTGRPCLTITADYPVFSSSTSSVAADSINDVVMAYLLPQPDSGNPVPDLETYSQNLIIEYRQLLADFPEYTTPWFVTKEIVVITDTAGLLALRSYASSYTGGAHPISFQYYEDFDARSGARLTLADIFSDDYLGPLTDTAEVIFRISNNLPQSGDLGEAGFWFDENRFALNDNFGIAENGLIFYYNNYEIAPYAAGPTRILIPYGKIKHLIRADGPLAFVQENRDI